MEDLLEYLDIRLPTFVDMNRSEGSNNEVTEVSDLGARHFGVAVTSG